MKAIFDSVKKVKFTPIDNNEKVLLENFRNISENRLKLVKDEKYEDISLEIIEPRTLEIEDNLANRLINMNFPKAIRDMIDSHTIMTMKDGSYIDCLVLTKEEPTEPEEPSESEELVAEFTDYEIKHITSEESLYDENGDSIVFSTEYEGKAYVSHKIIIDADQYISLCKEKNIEPMKVAFCFDKLTSVNDNSKELSNQIVLTEVYEFDGKLASDNGVMLQNPVPEYFIDTESVLVGYELKGDKIVKVSDKNSNTTTLPNDKYQSTVPEGYYVDPTAPNGYRKCRPGHIHGATYMHPICCIHGDHNESLMKRTILVRLMSETLGEVVLFSLVGVDDVRINMQLYKVVTATDMMISEVNKDSLFYNCFTI